MAVISNISSSNGVVKIEAKTCKNSDILGDFPKLDKVSCDTYSYLLGFSGFVFGFVLVMVLSFLLIRR